LPRNRSSRAVVIALAVGVLAIGAALFSARPSKPAAPARASLSETDHNPGPIEPPAPVQVQTAPPAASEAPAATEALATAAPPPAAESPAPAAPEAVAPKPAPTADDMLARAQKLQEQGKTKQALALYKSAAERMPQNSALLSRLSFAYLNQGRNADAAAYAARAVAAEPSNSEGWIVLGAARDQLGDHKAAMDSYRKCAELGKGEYVTECKRMLH
jgi:tetratricopeptide (TPR) repeat protein